MTTDPQDEEDVQEGDEEGGSAVCWLDRVCPSCGALQDGPAPPVCPRCGAVRPSAP